MAFSLEDIVSHIPPEALDKIGASLGLSADQVQQATHSLLTHATSGDPAAAVQNAAQSTGLDPSALAKLLPQVMAHLQQNPQGALSDVMSSLQSSGFAAQIEQNAGSLLGGLFKR